jgi:hypothetical protein
MLLADVSHIREVLLFPALRPEAGRDSGESGAGESEDATAAESGNSGDR